jgi:CDP-glucose 4,6-dehydratase
VDSVFHLAAQAIVGAALRNPLPTFEANIRGTYHLLEACRLHAGLVKRVVVASSDKAYGESAHLPYTEDQPLCGRHPYDVSKSCTDLLASSYYATYGIPVSIARCGNIFGGGDLNWSRIVPGTIRSYWQRQRPVLRSDGTYVRDYIYVEDAVDAYLALGEATTHDHVTGESFNFSTESYVTVRQIVGAIAEVMGERELPPLVLAEASHEIKSQSLSAEKARKTLGWKPSFSLEEGLKHSVAWYRQYLKESHG